MNNYKDKIDLFLAAGKIPKAKKKIQKVTEEDKSEIVEIVLSVIEKLSLDDKNKIRKFINVAEPKKNLKEEVPILPKKRGRPKKCI